MSHIARVMTEPVVGLRDERAQHCGLCLDQVVLDVLFQIVLLIDGQECLSLTEEVVRQFSVLHVGVQVEVSCDPDRVNVHFVADELL